MDQGSESWLAWRRGGLGGSDAAVIMGVSKWASMRDLWRDKNGLPPLKPKSSFITDRGNLLEPIVRARYELLHGCIEMKPMLFQHNELDFMRASMDGANLEMRGGLEIKYVGIKDGTFALVQSGVVPEKYVPQIAHQFFVTGFEYIDFFAYALPQEYANDPELLHRGQSAASRCTPDIPYIREYVERATHWWNVTRTGPEPEDAPKKSRKKKAVESE